MKCDSGFTESWLTPYIPDQAVVLDELTLFRAIRRTQDSGKKCKYDSKDDGMSCG